METKTFISSIVGVVIGYAMGKRQEHRHMSDAYKQMVNR